MADALLEMGMQVDILAWDRSQKNNCCNTEQFPSGTAQVTRFGIPAAYGARWATLFSFLHFEWSLLAWLMRNRRNYDIIHAFDLDTGIVAWLSSKLYRKKLVFHVLDSYADTHFFSDSIIKRMVHKIEMALINSAEATLICTEERKVQIQNSTPKRLEIIHNTPNYSGENETNRFELNGKLLEVIKSVAPEEVYIPHIGDMQKDHKIVNEACMVALRPKYFPQVKKIFCYETMSETDWDLPNVHNAFIPNVFVDISDTLEDKKKALSYFSLQVSEFPDARSEGAIDALAKYRGALMHWNAAEAFMLIRELN
jgi:hypothetical protein